MLPLRAGLVIGVLALAAFPAAVGARSAMTTTSPVGHWASPQGGVEYQWRAYKTGFEEDSQSGGWRLNNGCAVAVGDPLERYLPDGHGMYWVSYRFWHLGKGGAGAEGKNCTTYWKPATARVKIALFSARDKYGFVHERMTVSCDNKPSRVCRLLERQQS